MAKSKVRDQTLAKIISPDLLDLTKTEIKQLVKFATTEELHDKYARLMGFVELFSPAVKEEIIDRLQKSAKKTGDTTVLTEVGMITLNKRRNTVIDEYSLKKYLRRKRSLGIDSVYDEDYALVTKNTKVLIQLEEKGLVVKTLVLNKANYNRLKKQNPEFQNFEEDNPTYFLKGL